MGQTQESLIGDGVFPATPKKFPMGAIVGGIVLLGLGVLGGVMLGSFIFVSKTPQSAATYEECVNLKGSVVTLSYPGVCITQDGKRFVQSLTEEEQAVCGGWNTGGEIVCDCSGKLIKPACSAGTVCDSRDYFCQGKCGSCCWRGSGDVQYGGPYPGCDSDSTRLPDKLPDRVCELGKEYESNAVDGPDCQCPTGFQPEIIDINWGPCPGDGRITDCPSSRFKCSNFAP